MMANKFDTAAESQFPGLPGYHPSNLQPWLVSICIAMTVLGFAAVIIRLLCRRLAHQKWWWDDFMVVFAGAWALLALGFVLPMGSNGLGLHVDVVSPQSAASMLRWLVIAETVYAWALGWTKLSVLLMYYRVFRVRSFKALAWGIGVVVMGWALCITFLFVFTCVPVRKIWHPDVPGRCISQKGTWVANGVSTILTDVVILLLPLQQIRSLQLRKSVKIGLCISFGLGSFVVFASSYRLHVLLIYDKTDPTYTLAPTVGWTIIEVSAGIVSANLPMMLPAVNQLCRCLGLPTLLSGGGFAHPSPANRARCGAFEVESNDVYEGVESEANDDLGSIKLTEQAFSVSGPRINGMKGLGECAYNSSRPLHERRDSGLGSPL